MPSSSLPPASNLRVAPIARTDWWTICIVLGAIWLAGLAYRPLLSPDEGRYAEIAREMAVTGDFVTPRLNGLKYFEKPPLQLWITAAGFKAFGISDTWVRSVPALFGLAACIALYLTLRRVSGPAIGQLAGLIAAGCAWIAANSHFASLDMGLAFWLTVTLCGLIRILDERVGTPRFASVLVWVGMAGAFLSKGLIGIVIPVAAIALTALWLRQPRLLRKVRWWPGAAVFAVLVLPWLVAVQIRNPGFFDFFFIHEHFQRFATEIHRRTEPWWYFIPVLLLGGLPWLGHGIAAIRSRLAAYAEIDVLMLAWAGFVLVFFSLSGSKLPSYVLPAFPALAVWLARRWSGLRAPALRWAALVPLLAGIALLAIARPLTERSDAGEAEAVAASYLPWILTAGAVLAGAGVMAWLRASARTPIHAAILAVGAVLAVQSLQWGHAAYGERFSSRALALRVLAAEGSIDATVPFFAVATYDQTLPFYLQRTLTLVDYRDEMDMGLSDEPALNGPGEAELLRQWPSLPRAYALVDFDTLERWRAAGIGLREVARNGRRAVVGTVTAQ